MKNSLLLTYFFPPSTGGIQKYLSDICQNLPSDKIFVLTPKKNVPPLTKGRLGEVSQNKTFKTYYYQDKKSWSYFNLTFLPLLLQIKRIIKENQIKTLLLGHFFIPYAICALILNKFRRTPFILFTHGLEILEAEKNKKANFILKLALKKAKNIVVTTDFMKKKLEEKYPEFQLGEKIIKIPPGIDSNFFKPNFNTESLRKKLGLENKKVILTCSRLTKRKNHQQIISILPQLIKKIPDVIYLIVGQGEEKENLENLVRKMSLEKYVISAGAVLDQQLPYYYNLANVFCMPSQEDKKTGNVEGFGIVFIESLACGIPVIGSKTGGISEALENNQDGFLVDPNNKTELIDSILKILLNKSLAQEMGKKGREKIIKKHYWPELVKKLPL